jgi:phosphatidate cytidylyltransferase
VRARVLGSVIVVAVGLVPAIAGGPAFAALMAFLGLIGFREYFDLASSAGEVNPVPQLRLLASLVIVALAIAAAVGPDAIVLTTILFLWTSVAMVAILSHVGDRGAFLQWAIATSGVLYVGLAIYSAVVLRSLPESVGTPWPVNPSPSGFNALIQSTRGLAWTLLTILAIWVGDSAAYLVGRALGRNRLAPQISPGKTVEGAIGGLAGSILVAAAAFIVFDLGPTWIGALVGAVVGSMGQLGDLCESFIKRQAGRKDSGGVIPGHGGVLDRVDALLFAFPTSLILASALEWLGVH